MYVKSRLVSNECFPWPRVDLSRSGECVTPSYSHWGKSSLVEWHRWRTQGVCKELWHISPTPPIHPIYITIIHHMSSTVIGTTWPRILWCFPSLNIRNPEIIQRVCLGHWVVDGHKVIHDLIGTVFHEARHDLGDCRTDCGQDRGFGVLKRMIFWFSVCFLISDKNENYGEYTKRGVGLKDKVGDESLTHTLRSFIRWLSSLSLL
jgi:hypothetical protein